MKLKYIGPDPEQVVLEGGALSLPEGWPAEDHDEPDEEIAAEKLAHRVKLSTNKNGSMHYGSFNYQAADKERVEEAADSAEVEV